MSLQKIEYFECLSDISHDEAIYFEFDWFVIIFCYELCCALSLLTKVEVTVHMK